jgi:hypothetical protein
VQIVGDQGQVKFAILECGVLTPLSLEAVLDRKKAVMNHRSPKGTNGDSE